MPVHRHSIGAELHGSIGRLDEDDVVAHEHADAVALADAEPMPPAGDARRAIGNHRMAAPALAGDDAEIGLGRFAHCLFRSFVGLTSSFRCDAMHRTRNLEIPGSR